VGRAAAFEREVVVELLEYCVDRRHTLTVAAGSAAV
jgi:hypothetical protein